MAHIVDLNPQWNDPHQKYPIKKANPLPRTMTITPNAQSPKVGYSLWNGSGVVVGVGVIVDVGDGVMVGVIVISGVGAVSYTHLTLPTN